jgi:hypothetical protein
VLERLCRLDESPWEDLRGKRLDARALATLLRPYAIKPKVIRLGDATPRGYERADLHDAWRRYLPQPAQHPQQQGEPAGQDRCGPESDRCNTSATGTDVADVLRQGNGIRNAPASDVAHVAPVADAQRAGGNGARP